MDHHLTQQAKQLSRNMHNRERRRHADPRSEGGDYDNDRPRKRRSEPLKAAQEAYAAALAAAELQQQQTYQRCELCQASFTTEAQMQLHLAGPVHKKAEKKAAEEAAKRARQSQYASLAADALQAATWQDSRSAQALRTGYGHQQQRTQQQQQQQPGRKNNFQRNNQQQQQQQQQVLTHEQMLAAVRQADPLSLDGWVPPTIPAAPQQQQAVPTVAADVQSTAPELGINRQQQQQLQVQVLPALNQVQKKHQQQQQQDVDKFLSAYGGSSSEGSGDNEHEIATGHDSSSKQQPGPDGHPPGSDQHTVPAAVGRSGSSSDDDSSDDASSDEAGAGGHIVSFF